MLRATVQEHAETGPRALVRRLGEATVDGATQPARAASGRRQRNEVARACEPRNGREVCVAEGLVGSDFSRSSTPQEMTPSSVTARLKNGCETHASPQSRKPVAAVADEDLSVVEVVVLDRLRDSRPQRAPRTPREPRAATPRADDARRPGGRPSRRASPRPSSGSTSSRRSGTPSARSSAHIPGQVDLDARVEREHAQPSEPGFAPPRSARGGSGRRPPSASTLARGRPRAAAGCSRVAATRGAR